MTVTTGGAKGSHSAALRLFGLVCLVVAGQQYSALGVHRMEIGGQPAQPYQVLAFDREGRTTVYANREPHEEGRRPPKAVGLLVGRIVRR